MFESDFSHLPQPWPKDFPQELVSPEKRVRAQALVRLAESSSPERIAVLVELLKHERDPDLHRQAKALLLELSDPAQAHSRRDPYGIFRI